MSGEQTVKKVDEVNTEVKPEVKPEIKNDVKIEKKTITNSEIKKKRKMPPRPDVTEKWAKYRKDKAEGKEPIKKGYGKKLEHVNVNSKYPDIQKKSVKSEIQKKGGKSAIFVFIGFLIMILVIGGFVLYKRFKEKKKEEILTE